jgi:hypothetical protein
MEPSMNEPAALGKSDDYVSPQPDACTWCGPSFPCGACFVDATLVVASVADASRHAA